LQAGRLKGPRNRVKASRAGAIRQGKAMVNRPGRRPARGSISCISLCFQRRSYLINALVRRSFPASRRFDMSKPPPAPPTLAELRKEIDAIDEQVHRLLMARGDIIDRLIQVKQTQEVGS